MTVWRKPTGVSAGVAIAAGDSTGNKRPRSSRISNKALTVVTTFQSATNSIGCGEYTFTIPLVLLLYKSEIVNIFDAGRISLIATRK